MSGLLNSGPLSVRVAAKSLRKSLSPATFYSIRSVALERVLVRAQDRRDGLALQDSGWTRRGWRSSSRCRPRTGGFPCARARASTRIRTAPPRRSSAASIRGRPGTRCGSGRYFHLMHGCLLDVNRLPPSRRSPRYGGSPATIEGGREGGEGSLPPRQSQSMSRQPPV